ncbi:MAG: alpha-L-fucosidase, partial [Victivallales bacterium]|nr:alpha-L-fucosidase [Victivallales bacterium]
SRSNTMKLVHEPKWSIFYDVHTMPAIHDVGKNFDAAEFASKIADCGVDYIVFHARCNLGMAYYDTKIGIRHPSLEYDLFGRLVDECGKRDIAVSAYFNAGLSHEEALRHREWTVITPEGYTYKPDRMDNFFRLMCYNTGYADHLVAMVEETVENYPVSGVFLDCFHKAPCVCPNCIKELKRRGVDWRDERELVKFTSESAIKLADRVSKAVKRIRPGLLIYFNGISFEEQKESGSYLEFECLPTGGWGYELLPVFSRYMRHLGKLSLNMTGRFHEAWGDFGGIRTEASVEYDCAYGLANGMQPTIGDHFHPRGDINNAVFSLIGNVYKKLRRYQPWFDDAEAVTEIAVIVPKPGFKATDLKLLGRNIELLQGTARMLSELKMQFDILTDTISWEKEYKLLILPDYVLFDDELRDRIAAHLKRGGKIISSCDSGLDMNRESFALEEWGVEKTGEVAYDPAYFAVREMVASGMPDMPLTLYGNGIEIKPSSETETLADIVAPYFNREWDGEHGNFYAPPEKKCGAPAVTRHGGVVHFSHPVFLSYQHRAQQQMKRLMGNIIAMLLPEPLVKADDLPSFARVIVSRKETQLIIHLFSYMPELRGAQTQVIEEPIQLRDVKVKIRVDGDDSLVNSDKVKSAILAPDEIPLQFSVENGYAEVIVPKVEGYAMVVLEV